MSINPVDGVLLEQIRRLEVIAEAAAVTAEGLGRAEGASRIRAALAEIDDLLGQSRQAWDRQGEVEEWHSRLVDPFTRFPAETHSAPFGHHIQR